MDETRIPKILLYGRVDEGAARQGNHRTFLNSVKSLLREYRIDSLTLEEQANNRNAWRSLVYHKTKKGHEDYIRDMKEWQGQEGRSGSCLCAGVGFVQESRDTSWVGAALGIIGIHSPTATHWNMPGTWQLYYRWIALPGHQWE